MDVVSRYGGDEFIVLLPETDLELATKIAARLNNDLEKNVASTIGSLKWPETRITASIGIVSYPQHGRTGEQLLDNADKAMYRAKQDGKNRCQVL
jgi:diguanylate cyclase (GGDEF)-like protein